MGHKTFILLGEIQNSLPSLNLNSGGKWIASLPTLTFCLAHNVYLLPWKAARRAACIPLGLVRPEIHRLVFLHHQACSSPGRRTFSESICIALQTPLQFAFHTSPSVALG